MSTQTLNQNQFDYDSSNLKQIQDIINKPLKIDGINLMKSIPENHIKVTFFDPQYRGVLDKQKYGNEGKNRGQRRSSLEQMNETTIIQFIEEINRVLKPSGYLFLWIDKFHLCEGIHSWIEKTTLKIVDLLVWNKGKIGMGYRTRNISEFLLILQKKPTKAKGTWSIHSIPNVWEEKVVTKEHPHIKPLALQQKLIEATTEIGDIILDPAMGSGSVFQASQNLNRFFIGGDINGFNP